MTLQEGLRDLHGPARLILNVSQTITRMPNRLGYCNIFYHAALVLKLHPQAHMQYAQSGKAKQTPHSRIKHKKKILSLQIAHSSF